MAAADPLTSICMGSTGSKVTLGLPEEEDTWVVPVCEDETCEVEALEEPPSGLLMDTIKVALSGLLWRKRGGLRRGGLHEDVLFYWRVAT